MAFLPLAAAGAATVFGGLGGFVTSMRNHSADQAAGPALNKRAAEESSKATQVLKDTAIAAAAAAGAAGVLIGAKYAVVALMAADWAAIGASISGAAAAAVEGFLALSLAAQIAIPVVAVAIVIGLVAITCFVCKKQAQEKAVGGQTLDDQNSSSSSSSEEGCCAKLKERFKSDAKIDYVDEPGNTKVYV